MSTRATIHFKDKGAKKSTAIIYRHSDGYPEGLGADLKRFCEELAAKVRDTRFSDPSYLAAKWVVWDANEYREAISKYGGKETHICEFLSVGILDQDAGDIEFKYDVICDGTPTIVAYRRTSPWDGPLKFTQLDLDRELAAAQKEDPAAA